MDPRALRVRRKLKAPCVGGGSSAPPPLTGGGSAAPSVQPREPRVRAPAEGLRHAREIATVGLTEQHDDPLRPTTRADRPQAEGSMRRGTRAAPSTTTLGTRL